jgi:hypothetical protein
MKARTTALCWRYRSINAAGFAEDSVKSVSPDLHCREKKPSGGNADTRPVPITF